ncbi:MAG: nucleotide exchange factor GrpE [Paludibacteraceae bacterium]|nr:nucleotide exchange factor GrpE [Paludibacteraceae bacterium]
MKEEKKEKLQEEVLNEDAVINEDAAQNEETTPQPGEESAPSAEEQLAQAQARIEELEDKNLRMMAEFDNFRRRTNKEKLDLMATAGERIFKEMLPLVDDFERAIDNVQRDNVQAPKEDERYQAMVEGVNLIYQKFLSFLDKNDVHVIETEGADFNTDEHEAVTTFAAGEDKKGKVIDCTQKGYKLGEKVIRFAKVVVGE